MSHKNNKNSKDNKKSKQKTRAQLEKMKCETANELGTNNESKKLGKSTKKCNK